ncbi:asparagine synthase-related protein [Polyangium sp. y55x31]|uniref:asparagine synthase-related protein n=1 Tax=Polyangium sp. y55x31 TaxID=3042688 RepID=UPI0024824912|nr:asparagine synthase-related protein [Polyangium sp. y55x31]MDI1483024.1 asparagine synthase-related protein [Polyangium sp. y55x31]
MKGAFGYVSGRPGSPIDEVRFAPNAVTSPDGRFTLVFDGDVASPESVLAAYAAHGKRAIESLRGAFALGLWDATERTLLLARDPLGVRPLYFATAPGKLAFASEVWPLATQGFVEKRLSRRAVASFLATGAVAEPDTILEGVSPLPPATILTYREGHARSATYWEMPIEPRRPHAGAPFEAVLAEALSTPTTPPRALDERDIAEAIEALDQPSTSFPGAFHAAKSAGGAAFSGLGKSALFPAVGRVLRFSALLAAGRSVERAYTELRSTTPPNELASLVSPDIADATLLPVMIPEKLEPALARRALLPDRALAALDLANDLRDMALRDADVASRRLGIPLRAPLLDRALVEHALSLPPPRYRLTLARPATAPFAAWLKGPLRSFAERLLLDEARTRAPFLDVPAITRQWRHFLADERDLGAPCLFALTTLVAYLKSHDATI